MYIYIHIYSHYIYICIIFIYDIRHGGTISWQLTGNTVNHTAMVKSKCTMV